MNHETLFQDMLSIVLELTQRSIRFYIFIFTVQILLILIYSFLEIKKECYENLFPSPLYVKYLSMNSPSE